MSDIYDQHELICPKCGAEMKEFALTLRCRKIGCRFTYTKKFPPKVEVKVMHLLVESRENMKKGHAAHAQIALNIAIAKLKKDGQ